MKNRIKAYIVWLWKIKPKVKIHKVNNKQARLKIQLKRYCNQSPDVTPWPYKK